MILSHTVNLFLTKNQLIMKLTSVFLFNVGGYSISLLDFILLTIVAAAVFFVGFWRFKCTLQYVDKKNEEIKNKKEDHGEDKEDDTEKLMEISVCN